MLGHLHEGRAGAPQHYARGQCRPRTRPAAEYAPHDDASRPSEFSKGFSSVKIRFFYTYLDEKIQGIRLR